MAHLTDADSLDILAREGFLTPVVQEIIPTELIRKLVDWSLNQYFANGRAVAPTKEAIAETWAKELEQAEIEIEDDTETDPIGWAVEQLRAQHAAWKSQGFTTDFAKAVLKANPMDRVPVIQEFAYELWQLAQALSPKRSEMDLHAGLQDALRRYEDRAENGHRTMGMTFGLPPVDEHLFGIHPGEIAVVAAGSGVGKSWFAIKAVLNEWEKQRRALLWTLENPLPTVFDRMACMKAKVDYELWQRGAATEGDIERVRYWIAEIEKSENRPMIIHPARGERTTLAMVRKSTVLGGQSIVIDQLSHITPPKEARRQDRRQQISAIMYELQEILGEGTDPMSCLLLHQINREGKKESRSTGRYIMEHLAESADIERAVDFILTIYQSQDDQAVNEAVLQMLKGRRTTLKAWRLAWRLGVGDIRVREEIDTDAA